MSNEAEREAFEAWMKDQWTQARDIPLGVEAMQIMGACSEVYWQGWQARAAYQRTQAQPAARIKELEELLVRTRVCLSLDDTEWGHTATEKYALLADIRASVKGAHDE